MTVKFNSSLFPMREDAMKYRKFGNTDLTVSEIGFGMWPIGGTIKVGDYGVVDQSEAINAIHRAMDLGITLFDTAPAYGDGHGEEVLGEALVGQREAAIITTKCAVRWDHDTKSWITDSSKESILASVEKSLSRLRTDYLDILLIHVPDPNVVPSDAMAGLESLQKSGKARFVGISNFTLDQVREYSKFGTLHAQQVGYNIFDRRIENEMLPKCVDMGLGVMTYGALCHGLLSGAWTAATKFPDEDWRSKGDVFGLPLLTPENFAQNIRTTELLRDFAKESGHTLAQLALTWVLHNQKVSVALAGMRSVNEVEENVKAVDWQLSSADMSTIGEIMKNAVGTQGSSHYTVNDH
jgi:aryl-alcohol dehydrogenase-like predicted oxidoreductase